MVLKQMGLFITMTRMFENDVKTYGTQAMVSFSSVPS